MPFVVTTKQKPIEEKRPESDWPFHFLLDSRQIEKILDFFSVKLFTKKQKYIACQILANLVNLKLNNHSPAINIFTKDTYCSKDCLQRQVFPATGKTIKQVIDCLVQNGIVEFYKGSNLVDRNEESNNLGLASCVYFTERYQEEDFKSLNSIFILNDRQLKSFLASRPPVVYRHNDILHIASDMNTKNNQGKLIHKLNKLVLKSDISVDGRSLLPQQKIVRRQFAEKSCEYDGRLYGAIWENMESQERERILINGQPTVEVDVKSTHPLIAYSLNGIDYTELNFDPYLSPLIADRDFGKGVLLSLFNCQAIESRESLIDGCNKLLQDKRDTNSFKMLPVYENVTARKEQRKHHNRSYIPRQIDSVIEHNKKIENWIFNKDCWKIFNKYESEVLLKVVDHFVKKEVPVLTIHDSVRIQSKYKTELIQVYKQSVTQVLGMDFKRKDKLLSVTE